MGGVRVMAKYYYERYTINTSFGRWGEEQHEEYKIPHPGGSKLDLFASYYWDGSKYRLEERKPLPEVVVGDIGYRINNTSETEISINEYLVDKINLPGNEYSFLSYKKIYRRRTKSESRGDYLETIKADDGTYPDDGVKGEYWYVKREKASDIKVNVNGEARDISKVYVNINGQAREVTGMYANINGQAKEVL